MASAQLIKVSGSGENRSESPNPKVATKDIMLERGDIPVKPPVADPLSSYWHNPKSKLEHHLHSTTVPRWADYVIVGSGISGALVAYNLLGTYPNSTIVMLEARDACGGATGRNGGHTKAASYRSYRDEKRQLGKEEAMRIVRLEDANIKAMHALAEKEGLQCQNMACNTVDIVYDKGGYEDGKQSIAELRNDANEEDRVPGGCAWYDVYGPADAMREFHVAGRNENPGLGKDEELEGAFEYSAGKVNAYRFTTQLLEQCVRRGLKFYTNTPAFPLPPLSSSSRTRPSAGSGSKDGTLAHDSEPIQTISTARGEIETKNLIIATNGYTANLLPEFQGTIVPLRGQISVQKPGKSTTLPNPLPTTYSFIYENGYEYMASVRDPETVQSASEQHIVIGGGLCRLRDGGAIEYGIVDDAHASAYISKYLGGSLVGYFGASNWGETSEEEASERVLQEWTGIMGATADGRPFVGPVPGRNGVWIAAGFNGHGMVLCLKSVEALVEMIKGKTPDELDWFPKSFLAGEERMKLPFQGRPDLMRISADGK